MVSAAMQTEALRELVMLPNLMLQLSACTERELRTGASADMELTA